MNEYCDAIIIETCTPTSFIPIKVRPLSCSDWRTRESVAYVGTVLLPVINFTKCTWQKLPFEEIDIAIGWQV